MVWGWVVCDRPTEPDFHRRASIRAGASFCGNQPRSFVMTLVKFSLIFCQSAVGNCTPHNCCPITRKRRTSMLVVDNETVAAVHQSFKTSGKAAAVAELRRRFWLLDNAVDDAIDRLLTWEPEGKVSNKTTAIKLM